MRNLLDINTSYIFFTPDPSSSGYTNVCEKYTSLTHAKGYGDVDIVSVDPDNNHSRTYISYYDAVDNNKIRKDAISLMCEFNSSSIIVKYYGESKPKRILVDGSERLLDVFFYTNVVNERVYIQNGISFGFETLKRFYFPTKKEDFHKNMVVELYNDTKWIEYIVEDVDSEWEDIYKIFTKYEKIRIHRD
jgi:hypothetical protein